MLGQEGGGGKILIEASEGPCADQGKKGVRGQGTKKYYRRDRRGLLYIQWAFWSPEGKMVFPPEVQEGKNARRARKKHDK